MKSDGQNIKAALDWAAEPRNPSTRGMRLTAWQVAVFGTLRVDGAASIDEVASARAIPRATLYAHLKFLRIHFGISFFACEIATAPARIGHDSPLNECENSDNEGLI